VVQKPVESTGRLPQTGSSAPLAGPGDQPSDLKPSRRKGIFIAGWKFAEGSRTLQDVLTRFLSIVLIWLLATLAGCRRAMDRADLVFINGAEPELLDPVFSTAQATGRVLYALLEGLTAFDQFGKPQPAVAERWDISPDGRVYTFHLRKNALWSNGDAVTAHDFVYSWRRTLAPESAAEYAYQLHYLLGARAFNEGKSKDFSEVGVKALDDYKLEVTLEHPTPFFLDLCAFATLLPVHRATVEKHGDWSSNPVHHVGNGAFTLGEWRLFDRVRLVKNPRYWNAAAVKLASIDVLPAQRPNTAFNFFATGVADLMMDKGLAPTSLLAELKKRPDFHAAPFLGNYFVRFNCKRGPFQETRVRRAFSLAIDRQLLTQKITRAGEVPAWSFVPPGAGDDYQPPEPDDAGRKQGKPNHEKARQLLAEAGFPGGKDFPIFYYLYRADSDLDQDIAVELQAMFKEVLGVTMLLARQEWTVYLNSQSQLDYDLCRSSWVGDYNDPNTFLDMFVTDGGNNRTGWSKKEYDDLIAAAARELDPAKRYEIFRRAERILVSDEAPISPLYYYVGIQFYDPAKLGGIEPNLLDEHPLKAIYWKNR
jgi:oligopeptide transport system substrate-binding protein